MSELQKYGYKQPPHTWCPDCRGDGCYAVYGAVEVDVHIAALKRQHVEELHELKQRHVESMARMAGDQLARDADMYNLAEEVKRLRATLTNIMRNAWSFPEHQIETMARDALTKEG